MLVYVRVLGISYKINLNPSNNFKRVMVAFLLNKSDLTARSALKSNNHTLRTKPFWRPPDQVVRTWSWSMGHQKTPLFVAEARRAERYPCLDINQANCPDLHTDILISQKKKRVSLNILRICFLHSASEQLTCTLRSPSASFCSLLKVSQYLYQNRISQIRMILPYLPI